MGHVGRPHGIKGELSLVWHGEFSPEKGMPLYLKGENANVLKYVIASSRAHKGVPLVFLEGINDRNAAEMLRGRKIMVSPEDLPPLEGDESWLADLIGMQVELENGRQLGRLDHIEFPAGQPVWSIRGQKGGEILFPAQPQFLTHVDMDKGIITIQPPDGLLDIYNA